MKGKMKKVIEMTQILTEMDADAYMQCKYMLLVVSKRINSMNHLVKTLFGLTDDRRPLCIGMKEVETLKEDEVERIMKTDDIKIYPCFAAHSPKAEKMEQKEQYFAETGLLQSQITLDGNGYLINGFTSYLLAKEHGIQIVPVRYGKRQIVRASHKPGGKMYSWELPWILIARVHTGDRVIVRTERGVQVVTVAAVEEYAGNEPEPLRMVIRVK